MNYNNELSYQLIFAALMTVSQGTSIKNCSYSSRIVNYKDF